MTTYKARAVRITEHGDPSVLRIGEVSVRSPGFSEILVGVHASGLNRADILQRRGMYPAPPGVVADVPGLEYAGTVVALGEGVQGFSPGDRVMGIVAGGAMCTHLVVHEREALRVPSSLSLIEAAAVPEVFLTAYDALFEQAESGPGQELLLHAVGSGLGTAALALCLAAGIKVTGTSRSQQKLDRCAALGMHRGLCVSGDVFSERYAELVAGGADVVMDTVGGAYLEENIRCLAMGGRLVLLGQMGGGSGSLSIARLMARRARVMGSTLRARPFEEKALLAQRFAARVLPRFARGELRPVIDLVLPMGEVAEAHARMENNDSFGKTVLTWDSPPRADLHGFGVRV